MSPSDPSPEIGLSWRMRERETRLLAEALRVSRSTVLYAAPGASRDALLARGVVPLLARREADGAARPSRDARVVTPFIDRRRGFGSGGEDAAGAEHVVHVVEWGADPLSLLWAAVRASVPGYGPHGTPDKRLADALEALCERLDARLLVVLDAFEAFWAAHAGTAAGTRFVAEVGESIGRPQLRVNFLFVVDDRLEGRLDAMRDAVSGFDDSTVRLLGFARPDGDGADLGGPPTVRGSIRPAAAPPVWAPPELPTLSDAVPIAVASPAAARPRRARRPKTPVAAPLPVRPDGVYALIETTLKQTADTSVPWRAPGAAPPASLDDSAAVEPLGPPSRSPTPGGFGGRPSVPQRRTPPSGGWLGAAIAWWRRRAGDR